MLDRVGMIALLAVLTPPGVSHAGPPRSCGEGRAALQAQIEAACPCATAASRTAHVRCVNDKLRELNGCHKGADGAPLCRPVPRPCVRAVRRAASASTCGEKGSVACCIPRQHDCVNDRTLADGKKEGRCSGTDRPCDGMADCKIPRCRPAASAERCTESGGTPGTGQDCNTACAP